MNFKMAENVKSTLHEKCPITVFFLLVRIFPHLVCVRRDTEYLSVFSPNVGKYRPEKTPYLGTFHAVALKTNMFHSIINNNRIFCSIELSLREKCPNTELFLVRIFLYSDWIRRDTPVSLRYLSVFSPNTGKYGPKITPYLDTFHAVTVTSQVTLGSVYLGGYFWRVGFKTILTQ